MPTKTFLNLPKDKQARVMNTALKQFNAMGYDQVSVASLVKESGIPRGSFYQYFTDLDDVFRHLLALIGEEKMAYMAPLTTRFEKEAFIHLYEEMIKAGVAFAKDHPAYYLLGLQLYRSHTPEMIRLRKELEHQGLAFMERYLTQDQTQGFIRKDVDITLLARLLYRFNAHELLERFYEGDDTDALLRHTKAFLTLLNQGIEGSYENKRI